jgi:cell division protein FtsB
MSRQFQWNALEHDTCKKKLVFKILNPLPFVSGKTHSCAPFSLHHSLILPFSLHFLQCKQPTPQSIHRSELFSLFSLFGFLFYLITCLYWFVKKRNSDFFQDLDPQIGQKKKKKNTQLSRKNSDKKDGVKNLGERETILEKVKNS